MPDRWAAFVRARLTLRGLTPEREARIVEVALAAELVDRAVDAGRLDALALEVAADLGHRAVAVAEVGEAQIEGILKLSLRVRRPLDEAAHAAWP